MILDTHCHLDDNRYLDDLEDVIKRAQDANVKGFLIPGADIRNLPRAKDISDKYKDVFYAAGVHPYDINEYDRDVLKEYLKDEKCIAVGECGLDYFRLPKNDKEGEKKRQKDIFINQIDLAIEVKKPLIVHIREASQDSLDVLKAYASGKVKGGVLHCYNASEVLLDLAEDNFYFGIGGVLTFKNAKKLVEVLPKIPKDKIIIETDAPYLTPHPHRGTRNEPFYTTLVAKKIADIFDMSVEEVENLTTNNALDLFKEFKQVS